MPGIEQCLQNAWCWEWAELHWDYLNSLWHGANNAKVTDSIQVSVIDLKAGLSDPHGSFPTWTILWLLLFCDFSMYLGLMVVQRGKSLARKRTFTAVILHLFLVQFQVSSVSPFADPVNKYLEDRVGHPLATRISTWPLVPEEIMDTNAFITVHSYHFATFLLPNLASELRQLKLTISA